jgi:hypothetical protein
MIAKVQGVILGDWTKGRVAGMGANQHWPEWACYGAIGPTIITFPSTLLCSIHHSMLFRQKQGWRLRRLKPRGGRGARTQRSVRSMIPHLVE